MVDCVDRVLILGVKLVLCDIFNIATDSQKQKKGAQYYKTYAPLCLPQTQALSHIATLIDAMLPGYTCHCRRTQVWYNKKVHTLSKP